MSLSGGEMSALAPELCILTQGLQDRTRSEHQCRRFLLKASCQLVENEETAVCVLSSTACMEPQQPHREELRAINTVNGYLKLFGELQMLLSTGKLKRKRGKGHFINLEQHLPYNP